MRRGMVLAIVLFDALLVAALVWYFFIWNKPKVAATSPAAFTNDVSSDLDKITVTFDQRMKDGQWAWTSRGDDTYPKTTGDPSYDEGRMTCTLPVTLEPGKVYWVGINEGRFRGFRGTTNAAARPYVILFATKGADGKPTAIPEDLTTKAREINSAGK